MGAQERAERKATEQNHFLFPSHVVQLHKPKQGVHRMKDQLTLGIFCTFTEKKPQKDWKSSHLCPKAGPALWYVIVCLTCNDF